MSLADAHIHLFENGFQNFFPARPGTCNDEVACYDSLARELSVIAALVIGYEGEACYEGNNDYLARVNPDHSWIRPTCFWHPSSPPSLKILEGRKQQGFVGLATYVIADTVEPLQHVPDHIWSWLCKQKWLISCNFKGANCSAWQGILRRHETLRLVISHLGSPPRVGQVIDRTESQRVLADLLALSCFPHVYVKLSGVYSVTEPRHDYPHIQAWPYVEQLLEAFGPQRLVWGSDFTPCLDWLTFPQTLGLFEKMPFLDNAQRQMIMGDNLLRLLDEVV